MKNPEFQCLKRIQARFDISSHTLKTLSTAGKILTIKTSENGNRLYNLRSIESYFGLDSQTTKEKKNFIYARVSSGHQKADLQRQIRDLQQQFPEYEVIQDIASGLNFKRKGLQTLLEHVLQGTVSTIVVTYKDRLCRYGIELLEFIFKKFGTQLLVHSNTEDTSETRELADDLLAITTIFVARHNGRRSQVNRKKRKRIQEEEQTSSRENQTNPIISNVTAEG